MSKLYYVDSSYAPTGDELIAVFRVYPAGCTMEEAADHVAKESSIGTWTDVKTLSAGMRKRLRAVAFYIDKKNHVVLVAYPTELFESGNVAQLLSSVAGNIFGMKALRGLRLEDLIVPQSMLKAFKGPRYGIRGVRRLLKVKHRPLVGTIVKPKLGLDEKRHAEVAYEAWVGGVDLVKDDENLTNMTFNHFKKRVRLTLRARDRAERETGERKMYMANVTAKPSKMLERARFVEAAGGEYIMVDIITTGWAGVQELVEEGFRVVVHGHRAGHAAFTRSKQHGISMLVVAKLARMLGVDQLHVGAIVGKMHGSRGDVERIAYELREHDVVNVYDKHKLVQRWGKHKTVFPVCSGGLHPFSVDKLVSYMGRDVIIQAGGGIHGHPLGTMAGAATMRMAVDCAMEGIPLKELVQFSTIVKEAYRKWVA
jgi:ribulose-bisphosphate carboxylase large chain